MITKKLFFWALMIAMVAAVVAGAWLIARPYLPTGNRDVLSSLSEEDKQAIYEKVAADFAGVFDVVPEPDVGKIFQRRIKKTRKGAEVITNNAGMRSPKKYVPKPEDVYRIVCLGDSMAEGTGGRTEDRYANQIEEMLRAAGVRPGGKKVECYAVAVGSWSAVNEATYLGRRLSVYDPDLVLVLFTGNDITDTQGATGIGTANNRSTPEYQEYGSGVLFNRLPSYFGVQSYNHLRSDLGPEGAARWDKAFRRHRWLEDLVAAGGGKLVFGLLQSTDYFNELTKHFYQKHELRSPLILMDYLDNRLPHDRHPDRKGHEILATHYLRTIDQLGWLSLPEGSVPDLAARLSLEVRHEPSAQRLRALRREVADTLPERIEFNRLDPRTVMGFLGGIWPDRFAADKLTEYPFGTLKSCFLLRRDPQAGTAHLKIRTPPFRELYPVTIRLSLNGKQVAELRLESSAEAGEHVLIGDLPPYSEDQPAVELTTYADSYWCVINEDTMRSFTFLAAWQE